SAQRRPSRRDEQATSRGAPLQTAALKSVSAGGGSAGFASEHPVYFRGVARLPGTRYGPAKPSVAAPHRGEDLSPRRGGPSPEPPGAPARRLPAVGLSRGHDPDLRVLRRPRTGDGRGAPGGDVQVR